jgi:hypothetical protein
VKRAEGAPDPRLADPGRPAAAAAGRGEPRDTAARLFVAETYGAPRDQRAAILGVPSRRAGEVAARWVARGQAQAGRLGPGPRWVWLTKAGLVSCGLPYVANPPALSRLAHIRAVIAVRLALESAPAYGAASAYWRSERRLRARLGGRLGLRDHLPDAEVHWPGSSAGGGVPWAGECWAIEAELTPKTVSRTTAIMRELLTRTGDYGCAAADVRVPGRPPRHARAVYLCTPAAASTVARAREALGGDGARIEIRALPPGGYLPSPGGGARS